MGDNRNFIIAIFLSVVVFVGWQYFFIDPQLEAERARHEAVSDGSGTPYRVRVRPPCWYNLQAVREMLIGDMIADIIPTFGSINMIGGECDR